MCTSVEEFLDYESKNVVKFIVWISNDGKTNCDGHQQETLTSHLHWQQDAVGPLFSFLHWEWDVLPRLRGRPKAALLDFSSRPAWYAAHWFHQLDHLDTQMEYRTHLQLVSQALNKGNVRCKKKTHSSRGSGTRQMDMMRVPIDMIARLGGWVASQGHITSAYLTNLPVPAAMASAGFSPTMPLSHYYVPRLARHRPTGAPEASRRAHLLWRGRRTEVSEKGEHETLEVNVTLLYTVYSIQYCMALWGTV